MNIVPESQLSTSDDELPPPSSFLGRPAAKPRKEAALSGAGPSIPKPIVPLGTLVEYYVVYKRGLLEVSLGFDVSLMDAQMQWGLHMRLPMGHDVMFAYKFATDSANSKPVHLTERKYVIMLAEVAENLRLLGLGTKGVKLKLPITISDLNVVHMNLFIIICIL